MKTFGGVPWYDHVVRSDSEEDLYKPRDSREYVMERVLEDLNYACEHCYTSEAWVDNQKINRDTALAIKSRICLFEGTYRKDHRVDPSTGKAWDPEYNKDNKWLREAADACEELLMDWRASTRSSTRRPTWPRNTVRSSRRPPCSNRR